MKGEKKVKEAMRIHLLFSSVHYIKVMFLAIGWGGGGG